MPKHNSHQRKRANNSRRPPGRGRTRRISIRSELRREPDTQRIAKAVIALAMAQAEKEAAEEAAARAADLRSESVDE